MKLGGIVRNIRGLRHHLYTEQSRCACIRIVKRANEQLRDNVYIVGAKFRSLQRRGIVVFVGVKIPKGRLKMRLVT